MFTEADYNDLHAAVFREHYSGYKPSVLEIPNGDGKVDSEKRYAHVAEKYMLTEDQHHELMPYLQFAHGQAYAIGKLLGLPDIYMPKMEFSALRILDYPPGAISNSHEDFDLFTLMMYRDQPDRFVAYAFGTDDDPPALVAARKINQQAHLGQLGHAVGLGPATPHEVLPSETRQHSIVYFAIPDHASVLPSGLTVRDWLNERMARSRTEFKKYE